MCLSCLLAEHAGTAAGVGFQRLSEVLPFSADSPVTIMLPLAGKCRWGARVG